LTNTEFLKIKNKTILEKINKNPFVIGIFQGDLPKNKFIKYIKDDYNYIFRAIKNLNKIASKARNENELIILNNLINNAVNSEFKSYYDLLRELNINIDGIKNYKNSDIMKKYISFLELSSKKGFQEGIISAFSCYYSYYSLAIENKIYLEKNNSSIYKKWCNDLLSDEYKNVIITFENIIDSFENIENMNDYFTKSLNYENAIFNYYFKNGEK
jgi:thiaminase/transcriptional activator TenA